MMNADKFKIAILTGSDTEATVLSIMPLLKSPHVKIIGILLDTQAQPLRQRLRNLKFNIYREGLTYIYFRLIEVFQSFLDNLASQVIDQDEVTDLLHQSFPERVFCLQDVSERYQIPIIQVDNLNSEAGAEALRSLNADLGVVLGTRILKRSTFAIPRLGCINLHKGKVPEYRGMPPGFWELYEDQFQAGVTVHFVNDGLDAGDVIGEDWVAIHPGDSLETLQKKLNIRGSELLARCVNDMARGRASRRPQPLSSHKPRRGPTRRQRQELGVKLGQPLTHNQELLYILKTIFYFLIYTTGALYLIRTLRKRIWGSRGCVLLYHRVNNLSEDQLTVSVERFAEQMVTLRKYYAVVSTTEIVEQVRAGKKFKNDIVAITFDDCYRDVYTEAVPILAHTGFSACCFVSSGYVGTDQIFPHDANCPFVLENLRSEELVMLTQTGFEVGAHTVNHVDLGRCSSEIARVEVSRSKQDLERILGQLVGFFSFPFGRRENISAEATAFVQKSNYQAMFSAYGGYIYSQSDLFNLQRIGIGHKHRPLDLIIEVEGLSLGALKEHFKKIFFNSKETVCDERWT